MPAKGPSWAERVRAYDFDAAKSWYETELWKSDWRNRTGYSSDADNRDPYWGADNQGRDYWNAQYNELLRNRVFDQYGGTTPEFYDSWSDRAKSIYDTWDKKWNKQYPDPKGGFVSGGPGPGNYDKNWDFNFLPDPPPRTAGGEKLGEKPPQWKGISDPVWNELIAFNKPKPSDGSTDKWGATTDPPAEKVAPSDTNNTTISGGFSDVSYQRVDPYTGRYPSDNRSHGDRGRENIWQQGAIANLENWAEQISGIVKGIQGKPQLTQSDIDRSLAAQRLNIGGQEMAIGGIGDYIKGQQLQQSQALQKQMNYQRAQDASAWSSLFGAQNTAFTNQIQDLKRGSDEAASAYATDKKNLEARLQAEQRARVEGVQALGKYGRPTPGYGSLTGSGFNRKGLKIDNINV